MAKMTLEDRLMEMDELSRYAREIEEHIHSAESVETLEDFKANMDELIRTCKELMDSAKALRSGKIE